MNVLVINAGSSSLKYQLVNVEQQELLAKGICERVGSAEAFHKHGLDKNEEVIDAKMADHDDAMALVLESLTSGPTKAIDSLEEIDAVGHRIVQGGKYFDRSVLIDDDVIQKIDELAELAPLHNKAALMGINACLKHMPSTPMVAVFDTAFHQTMPPEAFLYGLPYEAYTELMVRRYGFHGTSHFYVSRRAMEKLNMPAEDTRIITCHLGNGSSIAAVKGGKCIDTSMGLTPLEGVPMGTRCGDMDPAIVTYLMEKLDLDKKGIDTYMNKKSGVLGISGVSSDFRDLDEAAKAGNERAKLALKTFAYKVKKYIGAYAAALGGVDAIVFTAGVGENDRAIREAIAGDLGYLGVEFDREANLTCPRGEEAEISAKGSRVKVFVIPTDEEMVIARDTAALAAK